jgi:small subunit ribosomal protein S1
MPVRGRQATLFFGYKLQVYGSMVDRNLLRQIEIDENELEQAIADAMGQEDVRQGLGEAVEQMITNFKPGTIIKGRVVEVVGDGVIIDVGFKSEGVVPLNEFDDISAIDPSDEIDVYLEAVEDETGMVVLSKRKADRIRGWQRVIENCKEGDTVSGTVMRKIKSGLLVDIGVPVFLPASQVDIRRPVDIGEYVGQKIEAKIIKIDPTRRNIVISRRRLIEEERAEAKSKLLSDLKIGEVRKGVVKNIADFGVFVDLGGMDGLLHVTDMSWDRIGHPSEMVRLDQEIEVKVLNFDLEREKVALGLKQLGEDPWGRIEEKYPIGSRVKGEVVNITSYGAFVKLEPGVEGLVHISEMSWTKRINHPSEMLSVGDEIEVVILDVNKDKEEISLGVKQVETNPWEVVAEKYPPNTVVEGVVRNLAMYGAFIELEEGVDGLLHISDMSWTKKITHPSELLKKSDRVQCVVLSVDKDKMRLSLGMKQLTEDPWLHAVPSRYIPGQIVKGVVTKITNFGVFVELEPGLEGLLHISEIADHKVENPQEEVKIGDELEVKILRVDTQDRKIGLSKKRAEWASESEAQDSSGQPDEEARELRGGLEGGSFDFGAGLNRVQIPLRRPSPDNQPNEES